jgi:hypothetical protein
VAYWFRVHQLLLRYNLHVKDSMVALFLRFDSYPNTRASVKPIASIEAMLYVQMGGRLFRMYYWVYVPAADVAATPESGFIYRSGLNAIIKIYDFYSRFCYSAFECNELNGRPRNQCIMRYLRIYGVHTCYQIYQLFALTCCNSSHPFLNRCGASSTLIILTQIPRMGLSANRVSKR